MPQEGIFLFPNLYSARSHKHWKHNPHTLYLPKQPEIYTATIIMSPQNKCSVSCLRVRSFSPNFGKKQGGGNQTKFVIFTSFVIFSCARPILKDFRLETEHIFLQGMFFFRLLADFRLSEVIFSPWVPKINPKPYKFGPEKAISAPTNWLPEWTLILRGLIKKMNVKIQLYSTDDGLNSQGEQKCIESVHSRDTLKNLKCTPIAHFSIGRCR